MVEEYQADDPDGHRGDLPHVSFCWYGVWIAGLGEVCREVRLLQNLLRAEFFAYHDIMLAF